MKRGLWFCLFFFLAVEFAYGQVVKNVSFEQREGTGFIDIYYDLSGSPGERFNISLKLSADGGRTFTIFPRTLTGDVRSVSPGIYKHITWDAAADVEELSGTNFVFQVIATPVLGRPEVPYVYGGKSPSKAVVLSFLIPSAGHFYNAHPWKAVSYLAGYLGYGGLLWAYSEVCGPRGCYSHRYWEEGYRREYYGGEYHYYQDCFYSCGDYDWSVSMERKRETAMWITAANLCCFHTLAAVDSYWTTKRDNYGAQGLTYPRSPTTACLLSAFFPGLGHVYNGSTDWGYTYHFSEAVLFSLSGYFLTSFFLDGWGCCRGGDSYHREYAGADSSLGWVFLGSGLIIHIIDAVHAYLSCHDIIPGETAYKKVPSNNFQWALVPLRNGGMCKVSKSF